MNATNAKQYLPLVQALAEEKTIQFRYTDKSEWADIEDFNPTHPAYAYRIKPEPRRWFVVFSVNTAARVFSLRLCAEEFQSMEAGRTIVEVVEVVK